MREFNPTKEYCDGLVAEINKLKQEIESKDAEIVELKGATGFFNSSKKYLELKAINQNLSDQIRKDYDELTRSRELAVAVKDKEIQTLKAALAAAVKINTETSVANYNARESQQKQTALLEDNEKLKKENSFLKEKIALFEGKVKHPQYKVVRTHLAETATDKLNELARQGYRVLQSSTAYDSKDDRVQLNTIMVLEAREQ